MDKKWQTLVTLSKEISLYGYHLKQFDFRNYLREEHPIYADFIPEDINEKKEILNTVAQNTKRREKIIRAAIYIVAGAGLLIYAIWQILK